MIIDEIRENWSSKSARSCQVTIRFSHERLFDASDPLLRKISKMKLKPSRHCAPRRNADTSWRFSSMVG